MFMSHISPSVFMIGRYCFISMCMVEGKNCLVMDLHSGTQRREENLVSRLTSITYIHLFVSMVIYGSFSLCTGPIFGNTDYFTGLGVFFDTYSNYNGKHSVSYN